MTHLSVDLRSLERPKCCLAGQTKGVRKFEMMCWGGVWSCTVNTRTRNSEISYITGVLVFEGAAGSELEISYVIALVLDEGEREKAIKTQARQRSRRSWLACFFRNAVYRQTCDGSTGLCMLGCWLLMCCEWCFFSGI